MSRQPSRTGANLRPAIQSADTQCSALADLFSVDPDEISPLLLRVTAAIVSGVKPSIALDIPLVKNRLLDRASERAEAHLMECSSALATTLKRLPLPPAYSIGGLAEAHVGVAARRASGVYFTDFLIAEQVVGQALASHSSLDLDCVDPAAGGGAFLVAAARRIEECSPHDITKSVFIAEHLHGVDRDAAAIDACASALLAESGDTVAVAAFKDQLVVADSLLAGNPTILTSEWRTMFPNVFADTSGGFGLVLGNPPWEKLKIHTHEHLHSARLNGAGSYGSASELRDQERRELNDRRATLRSYVSTLRSSGYELQNGGGDPDLYRYFFELALGLVSPEGTIALLLPGALVRAQGAEPLRNALLRRFSTVDLIFFENRARFFPIDTRFKFVACLGWHNGSTPEVHLSSAMLRDERIEIAPPIRILKKEMQLMNRGAGIPEILDEQGKDILLTCLANGQSSTVSGWGGLLMREVDMTRDRRAFLRSPVPAGASFLPVVEGRMVHQFRHSAKAYARGEGRSAEWVTMSVCEVKPQYWISESQLGDGSKRRSLHPRAGFCDITGQTNERTLLASVIPAQVVCGNKVPTILFDNDSLMYSWVALMNSLVVDWLVRRICTTTINYFILDAIPLPSPEDAMASLRKLGVGLSWCGSHSIGRPIHADTEARIECDLRALDLYGLGPAHLWYILGDFPLLDRSQPPIHGERRSTVTRDSLLLASLHRWDLRKISAPDGPAVGLLEERLHAAKELGARPYVATDLAIAKDAFPPSGQGHFFART